MQKFIYRYSLSICLAWVLIIFLLCATPGQYIPSANWLELLSFDKFVHAFMFFVLATLTFINVIKRQQPQWALIGLFLVCISYGALLELMQATCFSNRSADWKDLVANTFGCVLALLMIKRIRKFVLLINY